MRARPEIPGSQIARVRWDANSPSPNLLSAPAVVNFKSEILSDKMDV